MEIPLLGMPELPEVETIKRQLNRKLVGRELDGSRITGVRRRAKLLFIDLADGSSLVFHLKLTGQLILDGQPSRHTRKVFNFDNGGCLVFNDMRGFGWWKKLKTTEGIEKNFGPEPLPLDFKVFREILSKRPNSKIKPLLMDQKFIAGIGNIYSDEILFASAVRPVRLVKTLSDKEIKNIFENIKAILRDAIKFKGSSVQHYLDAKGEKGDYVKHHKVYRKEKCLKCGSKISRIKLGGRSAHFCPKCQV